MKTIGFLLSLLTLWLYPSHLPAADNVTVIPINSRVKSALSADWQGEWTAGIRYTKGAMVQANGNTYVCVTPHQSSASDDPATSPFWSLLASRGGQGEPGPQGPAGPAGPSLWEDGDDQVTTNAKVGIGILVPLAKLDVNGGIKIGDNTSDCEPVDEDTPSPNAGIIRFHNDSFMACNGKEWVFLSPVPTVYSSGHEWMDRNLGASRAATSSTDAEAYGDYYNWGRGKDGHEKPDSAVETQIYSGDDPGPGHDRLIINPVHPSDWRTTQNNTLWQVDSGINNPCPPGFPGAHSCRMGGRESVLVHKRCSRRLRLTIEACSCWKPQPLQWCELLHQ